MKHKQLTLSDRTDIQMGIEQRKPFSAIAAKLGKDPSTISKEVRRNLFIKETTVQSNCNTCPLLKKAQLNYETQLSEARTGVALNKEEFYTMDNIVSSAIKKGQHLNHIISSNNLTPSRASSYRYLEKGYLSARPIDFPRVVKFRKRRTSQLPPIPKKDKVGRTYEDFQKHQAKEDLTSWIE
ncbi:helix-turn-helix domain-containing protein, partial [Streptococcus equi subsp. zooepidemicus]